MVTVVVVVVVIIFVVADADAEGNAFEDEVVDGARGFIHLVERSRQHHRRRRRRCRRQFRLIRGVATAEDEGDVEDLVKRENWREKKSPDEPIEDFFSPPTKDFKVDLSLMLLLLLLFERTHVPNRSIHHRRCAS